MDCMKIIVTRTRVPGGDRGSCACPVCRQRTNHNEISYVYNKKGDQDVDNASDEMLSNKYIVKVDIFFIKVI